MTTQRVAIVEKILSANDQLADQNRQRLDDARVFGLNIMASPGAGKTSLILKTIEKLAPSFRLGVIEGDTAPVTIDADKITAAGMPAVQINTGGDCHLDAVMISQALSGLPLDELSLLIVENVGNLICPAAFRLGTHANILIASVPEGDDKPYKYEDRPVAHGSAGRGGQNRPAALRAVQSGLFPARGKDTQSRSSFLPSFV